MADTSLIKEVKSLFIREFAVQSNTSVVPNYWRKVESSMLLYSLILRRDEYDLLLGEELSRRDHKNVRTFMAKHMPQGEQKFKQVRDYLWHLKSACKPLTVAKRSFKQVLSILGTARNKAHLADLANTIVRLNKPHAPKKSIIAQSPMPKLSKSSPRATGSQEKNKNEASTEPHQQSPTSPKPRSAVSLVCHHRSETLQDLQARLKWEHVPASFDAPHISMELLQQCKIVQVCPKIYKKQKIALKAIGAELASTIHPSRGWNEKAVPVGESTEVKWHETAWTKESLLKEGFIITSEPTIFALGNHIKCIYIPSAEPTEAVEAMDDLASHLCNLRLGENKYKPTLGLGDVCRGKTNIWSGTFKKMGYHKSRRHQGEIPAMLAYCPTGEADQVFLCLCEIFQREVLEQEEVDVPAAAQHRGQVARGTQQQHTSELVGFKGGERNMSHCFSWCVNFVTAPHTKPGAVPGVLESLQFTNQGPNGHSWPIPGGHEWLFVCAGHLMSLCSRNTRVYIPAHEYHGTLPTHSHEPSMSHCGIGSAIVVQDVSVLL